MKTVKKGRNYSERLPRRIKGGGLCMAMDVHGVLCDEAAVIEVSYHGNDEHTVTERAPWVAVRLCEYHGSEGQFEIEGKLPNKEWFSRKKAGKLMFPLVRTEGRF